MKLLNILAFSVFTLFVYSTKLQAQLSFNGGGKLVISGGTSGSTVFTVLNSPPATPIVTSGSTDGIIIEGEYNRLQYNLSTASTAITVPYMSSALESFPLIVTPTSAGVGTGNIRFSTTKATTRATGWDNTSYMPSDVVGMSGGSSTTLDRFWIIDANGYTTKPAVTLSFTYIDAEWATNGGNAITETALKAQRYNNSVNSWQGGGGFPPTGSINTATNIVSSVTVPAADFYRSWVLTMSTVPLPIELLSFEGECENDRTLSLNWVTATEINNDYFTIESTEDGINWDVVISIPGAGTSFQMNYYSYSIVSPYFLKKYYRIKQTDYDGTYTYSGIIYPNCNGTSDNIYYNQNGELVIEYYSENISSTMCYIYNSVGQIIYATQFNLEEGMNLFKINSSLLSPGAYHLYLDGKHKIINSKIIITD